MRAVPASAHAPRTLGTTRQRAGKARATFRARPRPRPTLAEKKNPCAARRKFPHVLLDPGTHLTGSPAGPLHELVRLSAGLRRAMCCPRGVARRAGLFSGLPDGVADKIGARSCPAAARCVRGSIVAHRRVGSSATFARARNAAIWRGLPRASFRACSERQSSRRRQFWGVGSRQYSGFSNPPY